MTQRLALVPPSWAQQSIRASPWITRNRRRHPARMWLGPPGGGAESSSNAAVYREPRWPSEIGRCRAPLIYVSRTEISCTLPQCGHLTLSVAFQAARRLCTSVSMPVGACWCVVGQVKNREVICGSFPCTGGSATGLSATGACLRAAVGDEWSLLRI